MHLSTRSQRRKTLAGVESEICNALHDRWLNLYLALITRRVAPGQTSPPLSARQGQNFASLPSGFLNWPR